MIDRVLLEKEIHLAYSHNDQAYSFSHPEIVDVKNRFRYIKINEEGWVIKKSKWEKANIELKNAKMAYDRLHGMTVGDLQIEIIVPIIVTIGEDVYLASQDYGCTLQAKRYYKQESLITLQQLEEVLNIFYEKGIAYRGFLPRNTFLLESNKLCLIDWEDVIFSKNTPATISYLWETNYLLNWGYLFEIQSLKKHFQRLVQRGARYKEPDFKEYECLLCELLRFENLSISECRYKIMEFVLAAEKPEVSACAKFKHINDCAHIVADLFPIEIDVLFDIILYCTDEKTSRQYAEIIGKTIMEGNQEKRLKAKDVLMLILCFMLDALTEDEKEYLMICNELEKKTIVEGAAKREDLLYFWINKDKEQGMIVLKNQICKMVYKITQNNVGQKALEQIVHSVFSYGG